MASLFGSIAVTLDGSFLALPKFREMVNGGGVDFEQNGWHGLYVMSNEYTIGRIYPVDINLDRLILHTQRAAMAIAVILKPIFMFFVVLPCLSPCIDYV